MGSLHGSRFESQRADTDTSDAVTVHFFLRLLVQLATAQPSAYSHPQNYLASIKQDS